MSSFVPKMFQMSSTVRDSEDSNNEVIRPHVVPPPSSTSLTVSTETKEENTTKELAQAVLSGLNAVDRVQNSISGRAAQRMQEELQSFLQEAANMDKNQNSVRSVRSEISEEGFNTIDRVSRTVGSVYGAKLANMLSLNIESQQQRERVDLMSIFEPSSPRHVGPSSPIRMPADTNNPAILCYDEKGVITFCNSSARQIICANAYSDVRIENSPVVSLVQSSYLERKGAKAVRAMFGLGELEEEEESKTSQNESSWPLRSTLPFRQIGDSQHHESSNSWVTLVVSADVSSNTKKRMYVCTMLPATFSSIPRDELDDEKCKDEKRTIHTCVRLYELRTRNDSPLPSPAKGDHEEVSCSKTTSIWRTTHMWFEGHERMKKNKNEEEDDDDDDDETDSTKKNASSAADFQSLVHLKSLFLNRFSVAQCPRGSTRDKLLSTAVLSMPLRNRDTRTSLHEDLNCAHGNDDNMIRFKNLDTSEDSNRLCCDIYFCGNISSISKPYGAMVWIDKDVETDESVTIKIEDNHDEKKKTTLSPKRKSRDFVFVVAAPREKYRSIAYALGVLLNHSPAARVIFQSPSRLTLLGEMEGMMNECLVLPQTLIRKSSKRSDEDRICTARQSSEINVHVQRSHSKLPFERKKIDDDDDDDGVKSMSWLYSEKNLVTELTGLCVAMLALLIILCIWDVGHEVHDGTHRIRLYEYGGAVEGGIYALPSNESLHFKIDSGAGGNDPKVVLMRMVVQTKSHNVSNIYYDFFREGNLVDGLSGNVMLSDDIHEETEWEQWLDIENKLNDLNDVTIRLTSDSLDEPVALAFHAKACNVLAKHRIWLSMLILVAVYGVISMEIIHRTLVAMCGSFLALALLSGIVGPVNMKDVISWSNESTLGLLFGMMIQVHFLSETGLFQWVAVRAYITSNGSNFYLLALLNICTAVFSAFLDNTTTALLVGPVTVQLCHLMKIDPVPFLISEALFSNIGGTATLIGSVPNIIIGSAVPEHMAFMDFITHLCPAVLIMLPLTMIYHGYFFKEQLKVSTSLNATKLLRKYTIRDKPLLAKSCIVTGTVVLLFFLHPLHHIDTAWIACVGGVALLLVASPREMHSAMIHIEWDTLLFFAALFTMIAATGELGLIRWIADLISDIVRSAPESDQLAAAVMLLLWISACVSAVLANIPYTATMVPIVVLMAKELNLPTQTLVIALAFGACLGGCGTIVGASANLILAGVAQTHGHHIGFVYWMKVGVPTVILCTGIASLYMMTRYVWV